MKYTLSECIERINQNLNYPSISYEDIVIFLDQAIAELNTSLHIQIRPISYLTKNYTNNVKPEPVVVLKAPPTSATLIPTKQTAGLDHYYDTSRGLFKIKIGGEWVERNQLYGISWSTENGSSTLYKAVVLSNEAIFWGKVETTSPTQYDLTEILPTDWITLFLIPYVCFKYTVRDGDNGTLYAEEFSNGFQQLQNAYDVPSKVHLPSVAHLPAYTEDVKSNLGNLNISIPTRAILQNMLHGRTVKPSYGSVYDNGGWGI